MFWKIVGILKGILKNSALFIGKFLCRDDVNIKVWFYAFRLHLNYKKDFWSHLFPSEFCKIFKKIFSLEHSWASASDFIFDIFKLTKYMKVSLLFTFFRKKSKIKQKILVALRLGNPRLALQ